MTCDDVLEIVEAIAAGDVEVDSALRAHLETCPRCARLVYRKELLEKILEVPAPAEEPKS